MRPPFPVRQTHRLHQARTSAPGARYFVTLVTKHRRPWLADSGAGQTALATSQAWHHETRGQMLAATVMPDHIQALFELGHELTVGQVIACWKSGIRRKLAYAESFHRDFWEHQLLESDDWEDYALCILLNPYRAGLVEPIRSWPGWWTPAPGRFRFTAALDLNRVPPGGWIDWPDERFSRLAHGD